MLTKNEDKVMYILRDACKSKGSCLITPSDILRIGEFKGEIDETSLESILESLAFDEYFDIVYSDRKGEKVYCITLREKGLGYQRQKVIVKRTLRYKLLITIGFAVLSFIIGLILKLIF